MARCTPNARPRAPGSAASEIIASRGAVRSPLPVRSTANTAPINGSECTISNNGLQRAESAYPTTATALWPLPPPRSDSRPPTSRTSALTPL